MYTLSLNLEHHLAEYDYWADEFSQLPLYFMGFHGQADVVGVVKVSGLASIVVANEREREREGGREREREREFAKVRHVSM